MDDEILKRACLKSLEIIGEASRKISEDLKSVNPDVEWRRVTGMRNKLVHHYFGVDWEIVEMYSRMSLWISNRTCNDYYPS
jgi:uncharacterized protein with HEPN domain